MIAPLLYSDLLHAMRPELVLTVGALVVIGVDLSFGKRLTEAARMNTAATLGVMWLVAAAFGVFQVGAPGNLFGGVFRLDVLGGISRLGILLLSLLTVGLAPSSTRVRNPVEFIALVLLATAGLTLMAVAQQLLVVFLAIELASLSLYLLTGFDKRSGASAEAALKYFLFGGMAAAFLLFGFSLLYGITGSIELPQIAIALGAVDSSQPLMLVALVMVVVALGFKAAAAPFHLWAPDVYQGAPAPAAALIASASKLAAVTVFARLLWPGLAAASGGPGTDIPIAGWLPVVGILAAASIVLGNLGALAQSNVRRLLAYSAIAHAGIMLLGIMVADHAGYGPLVYYALTYGLATVGAFGVIGLIDRAEIGPNLRDLAGLHRRSPLLAITLLVCLLSLAGVPPLAGFFGKFGVFVAAIRNGGVLGATGGLALLGIAASAVGLYYYLLVLKNAWVVTATPAQPPRIAVPVATTCFLWAINLGLLALGLAPSLILSRL
ncbi:NADH-quinone oxidoreductase subunit N [Actomonas aquatica]|uniref:NADH-quinone oxidoreductase subunit N n=1 Tax=Actomonas aquatica TaxID=2866162 RepID=A0ABZ1CAT8_9BACT|nr:NADH-quinone oxidoreductase subunit N [Opitutus sp. WL0086]WRQ88765.1 NADH-quinone oxidoreductase subunit N [Opitutus sp. WL0086]